MAEFHINKLAAARRQLQAAIRMFFYGEDELAVHTVASAAYRMIRDLKEIRGRDEVEDFHRTMVFYNVRDYLRGTLPKELRDSAEFMMQVCEWSEALPLTDENSSPEDLQVNLPPGAAKQFWSDQNKIFNFLKHADRDSDKHISLDEVENFRLLMQACASYFDLAGSLGPEVEALQLYSEVRDAGNEANLKGTLRNIARMSDDEQLMFFHAYLTELRRELGEV